MKTSIALPALLLGSSAVQAAAWTLPITVSRTLIEGSDFVVVYTSDGGQYTPGCSVDAQILNYHGAMSVMLVAP